jgi:outer membrane protein assembly factor BamB
MAVQAVRRLPGISFAFAMALAPFSFANADTLSTTYQITPEHNGLATFTKPFAPPLKAVWTIDLGGTVSYPVVANNLAFVVTTGQIGTRLVALNISNGKIAWQKIISGSGYLASAGSKVFLTSYEGPLQAYRATDGKSLWSTQLPGQFFFDFVPIAGGGSVFMGGDESGTTVYQVDATTGKVGWSKILAAGGAGATLGGGRLYFSIPCDVTSYVPGTGHVNWSYSTGCDGGGGAVAAYFGGRVYAPDVNLGSGVVLNAATGKVFGSLSGGLPAFYGKSSYAISGTSLVATSLSTGNLNWSFSPKDTLSATPITVNGNVYTLSDKGVLYVNDGTTGKLLQSIKIGLGSQNALSGGPSSGLGVGPDIVLVPSGSKLVAIGH